jgi:hypothetical protein
VKRAKASDRKYTGILGTPPAPEVGHLLDAGREPAWHARLHPDAGATWAESVRIIRQREDEARRERWEALWRHFGIEPVSACGSSPDPHVALILRLAGEHIPAFRDVVDVMAELPKHVGRGAGLSMTRSEIALLLHAIAGTRAGRWQYEIRADGSFGPAATDRPLAQRIAATWAAAAERKKRDGAEWRSGKRSGAAYSEQQFKRWVRDADNAWSAVLSGGKISVFQAIVVSIIGNPDTDLTALPF